MERINKTIADFEKLADKALEMARTSGADEAEAFFVETTRTRIDAKAGKVESINQSTERGFCVRSLKDGGFGLSWSNDLDEKSIAETARTSVELSHGADADDKNALAKPQALGDWHELDIVDPELIGLNIDTKKEMALDLERAAFAVDASVKRTNINILGDFKSVSYLANSHGVRAASPRTGINAAVMAVAGEGDLACEGRGFDHAVHLKDFSAEAVGREAGEFAAGLLQAKEIPSAKMPVLFHPQCGAELFGSVAGAMQGDQLARGTSMFTQSYKQQIAGENFTLIDDGLMKRGYASVIADAEGTPCRRKVMVENGVFNQALHSLHSAAMMGEGSTGNAGRPGYRGLPDVSPSNCFIQPGDKGFDELIAGIDKAFYVVQTFNVGGIDTTRGGYSVGAQGWLIENGRLTQPVKGVTIAGKIDEMLKNILAVGSDLRFYTGGGNIGCPSILIDGMTIGGKNGG